MATIGPHKLAQDKGLMWRMYMTMFLMGILYAVFVLILWSSGVGIIFVAVIAGVIMGTQYFMSEKLILRSTGAKEVPQEQEPELYAMVERLAQIAEIPMPNLPLLIHPCQTRLPPAEILRTRWWRLRPVFPATHRSGVVRGSGT